MTVTASRRECAVSFLGIFPYQDAWDLQRRTGELRARDEVPDTLLLLEHPPTYTLGRTADSSNILLSEAELERRGIGLFEVDRGGDVTYHGPGQLVGYPIMLVEDRRDLLRYIRNLEETIIRALEDFDIESGRIAGLSGVWIGDRKIAAIGVKMGRVTSHGFALNVTTDLDYFNHIVPCGIRDKGVTSMEAELAKSRAGQPVPDIRTVAEAVASRFADVFERTLIGHYSSLPIQPATSEACSALNSPLRGTGIVIV